MLSYPLDMCTELAKSQSLDLAAQELRMIGEDCDIIECAWQDGTPVILAISSPLVYVCGSTGDRRVKVQAVAKVSSIENGSDAADQICLL